MWWRCCALPFTDHGEQRSQGWTMSVLLSLQQEIRAVCKQQQRPPVQIFLQRTLSSCSYIALLKVKSSGPLLRQALPAAMRTK